MAHIPQIPRRDDEPRPQRRDGGHAAPPRRPAGPPPLPPHGGAPRREPMLMVPAPVIGLLLAIVGIELVRQGLPFQRDLDVLGWFAFVPARYTDAFGMFPGGVAADVWTFVTYALLHGSWLHIVTNSVWLVAFGSAVARRFGALRFFVFFAVCAAAGAATHLAVHFGEPIPVVGASAAIAGLMAAAARFVFEGGPLVVGAQNDNAAFRRPARPLKALLSNRSAVFFVVIFFAINLLTGVGSAATGGSPIAWEAHLGGFVAGLLLFRWFDPVPR